MRSSLLLQRTTGRFRLAPFSPDSFERFALHFLAGLYPNAKVHPAGKSGHKQEGLDIEVTFPDECTHSSASAKTTRLRRAEIL
jgi:hypothetical protein